MGRLGRIGLEQPVRYERSRPGELVHVDVKKLGRIQGGAGKRVRDGPASTTTRPSPTSPASDETRSARSTSTSRSTTTAASPTPESSPTRKQQQRSPSSAARSPSTPATASPFERLLTDNGSAYRATIHALACKTLGIRHLRTRPYRPQTNGKAERFIRTLLAGWAYGAIYRSSHQRTQALDGWLWHYNHQRRHSALGHQPPISRTNLLGSYS
jgi:Integrase core domain